MFRAGAAARFESLYSDFWHRVSGQRFEPRHTALVAIDDPSLNEKRDEPLVFWTPHFAHAIATLKEVGARLIVIDFIFSGSAEDWISKATHARNGDNYDLSFRQQIHRDGVLLAGYRSGTGERTDDFVLPHPDYLLALPGFDLPGHIGLANLQPDADSNVRNFSMAEVDNDFVRAENLPRLALGPLAAVIASGQDVHAPQWHFGDYTLMPQSRLPIRYAGPPGAYHAVSFRKLLAADAAQDPDVRALAGRVVIIGAAYAGMGDVHPTPYAGGIDGARRLTPGPEIQASIVETLLSGRTLQTLTTWQRLLFFIGVFTPAAFLCLRQAPARAIAAVSLLGLALAGCALFAFQHDLLLPLAHVHLGLLMVVSVAMLMRLSREARARARTGALFSRYVSPQVVETLLASPRLPELGGQSREITLLFSDIRGFTTLSEKLSAPEVVELLNTYFSRVCAVLQAEGASIDKFIGDAVMAEFGAPLPQADHARRALRAALAVSETARTFRTWVETRFPDRGLPEFGVGVGVHTGEAVVGNIGASTRMEYTAIGDTVNLASRLEGMTRVVDCAILASRATVEAAGAGVVTGAMHVLKVKGRAEAVEAYEVLAIDQSSI